MTTFEQFKIDVEADLLKAAMSEGYPDVATWKAAMAKEWEALFVMDSDSDTASRRVLNQNEIDSLLMFDEEEYQEPQPPKKWNDWKGQRAWMKKIALEITIQPFFWQLAAQGPKHHGTTSVFFGPFIFRLHWPWLEIWD